MVNLGSNPASPGSCLWNGHSGRVNQVAVPATQSCATWIGIKRDLLDDTLVPFNADLGQNNDPEVAQRGRHLDA